MALMGGSGRAPLFHRAHAGGEDIRSKEYAHDAPKHSSCCALGIGIGKNVFHLIGLNERGAITLRQWPSRRQLEARLTTMLPCLVGMEACVGAHHRGANSGPSSTTCGSWPGNTS